MKIEFSNKKSENGFIYVASRDRVYYELALISCESLKDYYPDSDVTLFTHKNFLDHRVNIFDRVITEIPIHTRAKMWCMARTPYQKTLYNDCDSIIRHKDIRKIHNFLEDCDMFFGSNVMHTVSNYKWGYIDKSRKILPKYHGSLCGFNKTDINIDFMQTWFEEYIKQYCNPWEYGEEHFEEWKGFDMFTLWRMTSGKFNEFNRFNDLIINNIPRRYNNTIHDLPEDYVGNPVITQIDRNIWSTMTNSWKKIEKGAKDESYKVEKPDSNQITLEYN